MKKGILLLAILLATNFSYSQNCNCPATFTWLKETVENNDAGFQYVIDQKGEAAYKNHLNSFAEKVANITDKERCADTLADYLRFFRKGHIYFGQNFENDQDRNTGKIDKAKITAEFKNWEKYPYKEKEFNPYISKLDKPTLEGIWETAPYIIGIKKVKNEYIGFIIEGDGIYWTKGQVKFRIREIDGKLAATYYLQNHSPLEMEEVETVGNSYLQMNWITLRRLNSKFPADKTLEGHFKFLSAEVPLFEKLSDKTAVLRIPSFHGLAKKGIDSIIAANHSIVTSTENLIIDLRNNGGGNDSSYEELLPLIYTSPIRTVGVEYLSTKLNNSRIEMFLKDPDFDEDKVWLESSLTKLNENIGKFVNLDSTTVTIETFEKVFQYPKNVGIIINEGNGSTTEQFLLAAKQSKKVKLFGTTTVGVLDISNMHFITSPDDNFKLGYCLTRSKRIPDFTIDDKGIQPDFYIDKTVSKYEWIDFVEKVLTE